MDRATGIAAIESLFIVHRERLSPAPSTDHHVFAGHDALGQTAELEVVVPRSRLFYSFWNHIFSW